MRKDGGPTFLSRTSPAPIWSTRLLRQGSSLNLPKHIIESTGAGSVRVAGVLDTYAAGALRDALARALGEQGALSVDLSDVESCDFSTIQLLFSARRGAGQAGKTFTVTALSEGVARTCAALGLSPQAFTGAGSE